MLLMTSRETITLFADFLTVIISLLALTGLFIAHKRGFFRAIRNVGEYSNDLVDKIKKELPKKRHGRKPAKS